MVPVTSPYRLSSLIQAHDYDVKALAYLDDAKSKESLLVSGSRDGQVKVWGVDGANEASLRHAHHDHLHFVNAVAIAGPSTAHPAGLVVSGGADNNVRLFDLASGQTTACLAGHSSNVCCLSVKGDKAVSGSWDSSAIVWDLPSGSKRHSLYGHSIAVWCVLALANDTYITGTILAFPCHPHQSRNRCS
jgi:WD40 repeat protein